VFDPLQFPPSISQSLRLEQAEDGIKIWDQLRKKWLVCTPEEWVRQHCVEQLIAMGYSRHHMQVEQGLQTVHRSKRSDIVAHVAGKPMILVECKAPSVKLSQATFNQAFNYNQSIGAPYLWLTNGLQHVFWDCDKHTQISELPSAP
jgi:type I site-specific restriction endonuclease